MSIEENKRAEMPAKQGDLSLLHDPIAQQLLQSKGIAHFAYNWRDGTPRVVPIGFHWNGQEIVLATAADAPKTKVLKDGVKVAVSIDQNTAPPKILQIRGTVRTDTVDGIAPEYAAMVRRTMSEEEAQAHLDQAASVYPRMARIFIRPDWVSILDFETRLPSAVERAIKRT
ncbi:MAG TPA: pyridoxamine 5'-phosphate oxidase family protein [Ktedonobacterales bacterium]|nr:pyridoxamine 5'-phosphate oxidase family protein [Ktedonobacterales bacterium]